MTILSGRADQSIDKRERQRGWLLTRSDTIRSVDERHGNHRQVPARKMSAHCPIRQPAAAADSPIRLNALTVVVQIRQHSVISRMEDGSRNLRHVGENVTSRSSVFATLQARAELTVRVEQVEVVGADELLSQANDGALERDVAVMVGRMLRDVAGQLTDLRATSAAATTNKDRTPNREPTLISSLSFLLKQANKTLR